MALVNVAGATIAPPSPTPRKLEVSVGLLLEVHDLDGGDLGRRRDEVVDERPGEDVAVGVVRHVLVQHRADSLGDTAGDLAVDDRRVDDAPAVLHDDVAEDLHEPGGRRRPRRCTGAFRPTSRCR